MPRSAFNTLWAEAPAQFDQPDNPLIATGWEGGADKDPPEASYQNWWQNRVDSILQEIERQGAPSWLPDAVYSMGGIVYHAGSFRLSLVNANVGNNPATATAQWRNLGQSLGFVPPNGAILWYGTPAEVPIGWRICDGTNGTPDMRDRVAVGAGATYALGAAGGTNTATTSSNGAHAHTAQTAGAHSHTITVLNHTLTIDQIPPHVHAMGFGGVGNTTAGLPQQSPILTQPANTAAAGGGQGHNHGASSAQAGDHTHVTDTAGAHTHNVDVRQPYRAWHFIMRVAA